MQRRANRWPGRAGRWTLGHCVAALACGGTPAQPEPTKLSEARTRAEERALVEPPARPQKAGPFDNPDRDPPGPPGAQIAAAEIDAALAEAKQSIAAGTLARAVPPLQRCANKQPASARCDGELGIVLAELGTQKAHMRHFLAVAAKTNDPQADADLYRRVAAAARKRGQSQARADAMATLAARGEATAADDYARGQALSADERRLGAAIDALRDAYAKDPSQHAWLLERAVLVAQTEDWAQAATLLRAYLDVIPPDAPGRAAAEQRLAMVEANVGSARAPAP